MTELQWGGAFQAVDPVSRTLVSGQVWGVFAGTVPPEQEGTVRAILVGALPTVVQRSGWPLLQLVAQPATVASFVQQEVGAQLAALGVSGVVQVHGIQLAPESAAQLHQATGTAPAPAGVPVPGGMVGRVVGAAQSGGLGRGKLIALIVGLVVVAVAGSIVFLKFKDRFIGGGKGTATYAQFGIDPAAAELDEVLAAADKLARRWTKKSAWWAFEAHGVRPDGTVDFTGDGSVVVTYIVPGRVKAAAKSKRRNAMKKIRFGGKHIRHNETLQAKKRWRDVRLPPRPECGPSQLARGLREHGLTDGKTTRITFTPKFAYGPGAPRELSWRAISEDPPLDAWFSMSNCEMTLDRRAEATPAGDAP